MMELLPDDDPTPVAPVTLEAEPGAEPLPPEPPVPAAKPARDEREMPVALVFASRTGGEPHVVSVITLREGPVVVCRCMAMLNLSQRPKGCHAMVRAREMLGMEPIA